MIRSLGRWLAALEPRIAKWIEIVGGVAAAAGAIVALYFTFWPRETPCPAVLSGALGPPTVDLGVTYRQYLERTGESADVTDPGVLNRIGNVVDFLITAIGYRDARLPVRWSTLTDRGGTVGVPELTNQLAFEIQPEGCSDSGRRLIWTPLPPRPGRYIDEINLLDDDGERLDTRRTDAFRVP